MILIRNDRRSFSSRASSASLSDDDDAITPADVVHVQAHVLVVDDHPDVTAPTTTDTAHLWRRMLALQRRYHCYNSARISAALESALVEAVVPPRACLDLLNDSVAAELLPAEVRRAVDALTDVDRNDAVDVDVVQADYADTAESVEIDNMSDLWLSPPAVAGPVRPVQARSKARQQRRRRAWRERR